MATLAIARLTVANGLRQPLTWLATALGLVLLGLSVLFGMFTFIDEDRMRLLLTAGVAVVVLNGLFLGVVGASGAVHDELASRTALTLFAKPMGRGGFLFGKALGAWSVAATSCAVLIAAHLALVALVNTYGFEPGAGHHHHDGHHHHVHFEPVWVPWGRLAGAHALALAGTAAMTCLAAALALRLGLVANILVCFAVFVGSHLLTGIGLGVHAAGLVPALALFNIDEALQFPDLRPSLGYFLLCLCYAALYSAGFLLAGLALFKRQDIP